MHACAQVTLFCSCDNALERTALMAWTVLEDSGLVVEDGTTNTMSLHIS